LRNAFGVVQSIASFVFDQAAEKCSKGAVILRLKTLGEFGSERRDGQARRQIYGRHGGATGSRDAGFCFLSLDSGFDF
jgi:hypothetical protein